MESKQFDGIAIISETGNVTFKSGYPESEQIFSKQSKKRGSMTIEQNGDLSFEPDKTNANVVPQQDTLIKDGNLTVKRTTQNYIVTMKFRIQEKTVETSKGHKTMWDKAFESIKEDHENIKKTF